MSPTGLWPCGLKRNVCEGSKAWRTWCSWRERLTVGSHVDSTMSFRLVVTRTNLLGFKDPNGPRINSDREVAMAISP